MSIDCQLQIRAPPLSLPEIGLPDLASQPAAALLNAGSLQRFPLRSQTQAGLLVLFSVGRCSKMGERRVIGVMSGSMSKPCVTKHTEMWIVGFY